MKKLTFALLALTMLHTQAIASESKHHKQINWPFDGALGKVERQSAQRGFQVYKEVCAACHGLNRVAFRTLSGIGFSEAEIKALSAEYQVQDGPNDEGEMFKRPGKPSDKFVPPFANDNAAQAANGGAIPPDLSLIIKSRHDGANYLYSLMTGYDEPVPAGEEVPDGMYYNPYFINGHLLRMPAPLTAGRVTYMDGTEASVDQMAYDVVNFLQWAAEPEMEERKHMGIKVMIFLFIMTGLLWIAKKRVWKKLH